MHRSLGVAERERLVSGSAMDGLSPLPPFATTPAGSDGGVFEWGGEGNDGWEGMEPPLSPCDEDFAGTNNPAAISLAAPGVDASLFVEDDFFALATDVDTPPPQNPPSPPKVYGSLSGLPTEPTRPGGVVLTGSQVEPLTAAQQVAAQQIIAASHQSRYLPPQPISGYAQQTPLPKSPYDAVSGLAALPSGPSAPGTSALSVENTRRLATLNEFRTAPPASESRLPGEFTLSPSSTMTSMTMSEARSDDGSDACSSHSLSSVNSRTSGGTGSSAGKRMKRNVTVACNACRKARRRCDGSMPCKRCSSRNTECVYPATVEKRGRKPKKTLEVANRRARNDRLLTVATSRATEQTLVLSYTREEYLNLFFRYQNPMLDLCHFHSFRRVPRNKAEQFQLIAALTVTTRMCGHHEIVGRLLNECRRLAGELGTEPSLPTVTGFALISSYFFGEDTDISNQRARHYASIAYGLLTAYKASMGDRTGVKDRLPGAICSDITLPLERYTAMLLGEQRLLVSSRDDFVDHMDVLRTLSLDTSSDVWSEANVYMRYEIRDHLLRILETLREYNPNVDRLFAVSFTPATAFQFDFTEVMEAASHDPDHKCPYKQLELLDKLVERYHVRLGEDSMRTVVYLQASLKALLVVIMALWQQFDAADAEACRAFNSLLFLAENLKYGGTCVIYTINVLAQYFFLRRRRKELVTLHGLIGRVATHASAKSIGESLQLLIAELDAQGDTPGDFLNIAKPNATTEAFANSLTPECISGYQRAEQELVQRSASLAAPADGAFLPTVDSLLGQSGTPPSPGLPDLMGGNDERHAALHEQYARDQAAVSRRSAELQESTDGSSCDGTVAPQFPLSDVIGNAGAAMQQPGAMSVTDMDRQVAEDGFGLNARLVMHRSAPMGTPMAAPIVDTWDADFGDMNDAW